MRKLLLLFGLCGTCGIVPIRAAEDLAKGFAAPPASARPWVYWFPLDGNLSKEGISADLEAMQRVGIGGVLYMETEQGTPRGRAAFAGPLWRDLFRHACREAQRLGLEINMNNDAGWCGSGGPWITPELSMQKVVWTETVVQGPAHFHDALKRPEAVRDYYRDIAVLAMPIPEEDVRLASIQGKASYLPQHFPPQPAEFAPLPPKAVIPRAKIVELTAQMDAGGRLDWEVPAGRWLVLRFGHTTTKVDNHPAPMAGRGLESDKLSKEATEVHYKNLIARLVAENRATSGPGKTLVSTHIDSWETGSQNWTPRMRDEFRRRRGYDILPWLPTFTGRAVESREASERFLWDLRQTVSDMLIENYAAWMRELAHRDGLRLSIEAYDNVPCDEMAYGGTADEPMAEFWSWPKFMQIFSCTEMASAAHVYGRPILGAESFTASNDEKWLGHPGLVKDLGDWAFCEGINRFVFHRYAAQPWTRPNRAPGISMGPWGLHYERTQTWWEQSRAWHRYLARCQFLLRQGLFVADICYLQPEGAPRRFAPPPTAMIAPNVRGGYNFDGCTPEVVLTRMSVRDGRIVLPDGMSYRALVLPRVETMTPTLLAKIAELVAAGATVVAPTRPEKAPGLSDYPACDERVKNLASELWGTGPPPAEISVRNVGKGRIVWGGGLATAVALPHASMDRWFGQAKWIWTSDALATTVAPPGTRYFRRLVTIEPGRRIVAARLLVAADNSFVCWINGRQVAEGGSFSEATAADVTSALHAGENLIAVAAKNVDLTPNPAGLVGLIAIRLDDGRALQITTDQSWQASSDAPANWHLRGDVAKTWGSAKLLGPMGMAPWGAVATNIPNGEIFPDAVLVNRWLGDDGLPPDFSADRPLRHIHRRTAEADIYFVANGAHEDVSAVCSFRTSGKQPELWHPETGQITALPVYETKGGRTHIPLRLGPAESVFIVFRHRGDESARIVSITRDGQELLRVAGSQTAAGRPPVDLVRGEVVQSGVYVLEAADGSRRQVECASLPPPVEAAGPWQVAFDPNWGGPPQVTFEKLVDWSKRPEKGIKYYSGAATYRTTVRLDEGRFSDKDLRWSLDLGRVDVMAEIRLNGRDLGILWKTPYRVDVTEALKPGDNALEIKVVNLWINRQIGDEHLPDDSPRTGRGAEWAAPGTTLTAWPQWLLDGKPSPTGRYTFTSWRLWTKDDPLAPSGLLGPVRFEAAKSLRFSAHKE